MFLRTYLESLRVIAQKLQEKIDFPVRNTSSLQLHYSAIFQAKSNIFSFCKKFLVASIPLY